MATVAAKKHLPKTSKKNQLEAKTHSLQSMRMSGSDLAKSPIVGIWKDRTDIGDSTEYVRQMRHKEEQRGLQR
ncbi:MAG: hypothetical protein MUF71_03870 [Candidatus Kapabacteria bacterium]|nr:hypothetical protein [Candidatus Kapabacteria bacterium]